MNGYTEAHVQDVIARYTLPFPKKLRNKNALQLDGLLSVHLIPDLARTVTNYVYSEEKAHELLIRDMYSCPPPDWPKLPDDGLAGEQWQHWMMERAQKELLLEVFDDTPQPTLEQAAEFFKRRDEDFEVWKKKHGVYVKAEFEHEVYMIDRWGEPSTHSCFTSIISSIEWWIWKLRHRRPE